MEIIHSPTRSAAQPISVCNETWDENVASQSNDNKWELSNQSYRSLMRISKHENNEKT